MPYENNELSYVIRFHNPKNMSFLEECLASVSGQRYRPVSAFVALQNFSEAEMAHFINAIILFEDVYQIRISYRNYMFQESGDHRADLLNRALSDIDSRFVAILDYDDLVYPNHGTTLISELSSSQTAIAFGKCIRSDYSISRNAIHITAKYAFHKRPNITNFLASNCFPIHSFIIDRSRLVGNPQFWQGKSVLEDYKFLLDVIEQNKFSLGKIRTPVCEYRISEHGENTALIARKARTKANKEKWKKTRQELNDYKMDRIYPIPYREFYKLFKKSRKLKTVIKQNIKAIFN